MISSFSRWVAYFEDLAKSHEDLKGFIFGDSERILSALPAGISFPLLWLESPEFNFPSDLLDSGAVRLEFSFLVLYQVQGDKWKYERALMDEAFLITSDLIQRISADRDAVGLEMVGGWDVYLVEDVGPDHLVGFRASNILSASALYACRDKFSDLVEPGVFVSFSYALWDAGGDLSFSINEDTEGLSGWSTRFMVYTAGGLHLDEAAVPGSVTISGATRVLVVLRRYSGSLEKWASAVVALGDSGGESYPLRLSVEDLPFKL